MLNFKICVIILRESRDDMKRRLRWKRVVMLFLVVILLIVLAIFLFFPKDEKKQDIKMISLIDYKEENIKEYAKDNKLDLTIEYSYHNHIEEGKVISQSILEDEIVKENDKLLVVISKGMIPIEEYEKANINELGKVPIMMYHGIVDTKSSETKYTGGNVDKDGYNRTTEAFRSDLEFYYKNNYRMIRLTDYVDGNIDVEFGKTPIILTFDDGREDNFKVLEKKDGKLIIDPNCAIGILEEFKKKYPDFNVTATFFVNEELFNQKEYNEDILKWLVENGYDIGNHTLNHPDFTKINKEKASEEVAGIYQILDNIIPNKYVNIVALPYGSPYKTSHNNFNTILNSEIDGKTYQTKAALRVGWEAELSPFNQDFNSKFLKRIRAYDNNGKEFDIEMSFKLLEKNRYISDGDKDTIVILEEDKQELNDIVKTVITY